jgi:hypothetical protein
MTLQTSRKPRGAPAEYTAWHIARLRDRLARYRAVETLNGRARTWARVATDIMDSEGISEELWSREKDDKVFGEALRRFVDQQQVPHLQRLDAITLFLQSKGYFTDEDIQEAAKDYAAALGLHSFFGAPDGGGDDALIGVFTTARKAGRSGSRAYTLEIAATDRPGILRFNETVVYNPSHAASDQVFLPRQLRTYAGQKTERFEGWIVRRSSGDWVALVQDRLHGERQLFIVPHAARGENDEESFLVMIRTGAYGDADNVTGIGPARAVMVAGDVAEWARINTWAYRYRPAEAPGGRA